MTEKTDSEISTKDNKNRQLDFGYNLLSADDFYHILNKKASGKIKA